MRAYEKLTCSFLLAGGCLIAAAPVPAQDRIDPMAATVAQRFTMIEESFVALADAMPADKYGFAPTNGDFKGVRTFGEQVKHVACGNFAFFNEIEKKTPPRDCDTGGPSPATTKAEIMTYLRESFAYAQRVLRTMTPANALDPAGGPYGGESTRLGLTTLAVWHASDHYGQLVVYLRMNGIVPPASRTPRPPKAVLPDAKALTIAAGAGGFSARRLGALPRVDGHDWIAVDMINTPALDEGPVRKGPLSLTFGDPAVDTGDFARYTLVLTRGQAAPVRIDQGFTGWAYVTPDARYVFTEPLFAFDARASKQYALHDVLKIANYTSIVAVSADGRRLLISRTDCENCRGTQVFEYYELTLPAGSR